MRASSRHFAAPGVSAFGSTRFEVEVEVEVEVCAGLLRAQLRSDKHDMVISGSRSESEGVENVTVDGQKALFGRAAPTDVVCGCCWLGGPAYCNRRRTPLPRGFKFQASSFNYHDYSHRFVIIQVIVICQCSSRTRSSFSGLSWQEFVFQSLLRHYHIHLWARAGLAATTLRDGIMFSSSVHTPISCPISRGFRGTIFNL